MKANNGSGNNVTRDFWKTPQELFNKLNRQYNFSFDCCAMLKDTKTELYSNDFEKITKVELEDHVCWINPPFSKAYFMFFHFFKVVSKGVAIYRADNFETGIYQNLIFKKASWIFIFDKRIIYEGMKGSSPRFPSALIGLNIDPPKFLGGTLLKIQ